MTDPRMRYYLAGPMSGLPEQNYPAFTEACTWLRLRGFEIISPHETIPHNHEPNAAEWRSLLRKDTAALLTCQGIILLPGWCKSKGAQFELSIALTLGMPVLLF